MKLNLVRASRICAVWLLALGTSPSVPGGAADSRQQSTPPGWKTVELVQTNTNPRFVTNLIEVRVPHNVFVNEYRTNRFQRTLTNVVDVAVTNWSAKTLTNTVLVNLVRTNVVDRYQTNWITRTVTNRTTLTLTNWETVVVTKTNWIKQPMTNVIAVNVPVNTPVAVKEAPKIEVPPAEADILVLDAVKTARPLENKQVEVKFKVALMGDPAAVLEVQQWRVERDDGAALFFAQGQEFKRLLPTGRYIVRVKARRDANSPLLALQSALDVTQDAVAQR